MTDVANMTLDQVFFRLTDRDNLRDKKGRIKTVNSLEFAPKTAADGSVAARDADGNPIRLKCGGESKAGRLNRELREKEEAEWIANREKKNKRRRRKKN